MFPGIALARQLPGPVLFLCTSRSFDKEQLERHQLDFRALPAPRLPSLKRPWTFFTFGVNLLRSLFRSYQAFLEFKPDLVVGLGGYGAFSPLIIALLRGVPLVLLEQNVRPGRISRLFAPFAAKIFCQWPESFSHFRSRRSLLFSGSPVRSEVLSCAGYGKARARQELGLSKKYIILVIGGSQGAGALNQAALNNMERLAKIAEQTGVIHLTGPGDYREIKEAYERAGLEHLVMPFSDKMGPVYAASDLAFSRAGGMAIAEMMLFGLPVFLAPYPQAADNHQFFNALAVCRKGAGVLIRQEFLDAKMAEVIDSISQGRMPVPDGMVPNARALAMPGAASDIISSLSGILSG